MKQKIRCGSGLLWYLGKQDWGLCTNHPDIFIRLHDLRMGRQTVSPRGHICMLMIALPHLGQIRQHLQVQTSKPTRYRPSLFELGEAGGS